MRLDLEEDEDRVDADLNRNWKSLIRAFRLKAPSHVAYHRRVIHVTLMLSFFSSTIIVHLRLYFVKVYSV